MMAWTDLISLYLPTLLDQKRASKLSTVMVINLSRLRGVHTLVPNAVIGGHRGQEMYRLSDAYFDI